MNRRVLLLVLAVSVAVAGSVYGQTAGTEPLPGRGGFLEELPSWFAKAKVSELPLPGKSYTIETTGSGCWISDNLFLTCWHNYRDTWGKSGYRNQVQDHLGNRYDVEIAGVNQYADLVVMRVLGKVVDHGVVSVSTDPESTGDHTAYGVVRDGVRLRWSNGTVFLGDDGTAIKFGDSGGEKVFVITDAQIVPGMSGGPSINAAGELIGINIRNPYPGPRQTTMVSLSTIQDLLNNIDVVEGPGFE